MNKNLFRLVFNAARGQIMAVAEVATSRGASAADGAGPSPSRAAPGLTGSRPAWPGVRSTIAGICALLLALPPGQWAQAQVIADPNAAAALRPQVLSSASGTPQVNIQTPSAAGVSRNVYTQFDVNSRGVILNNSTANVQTQLGGWVQANGNLAGGSARVILNEVNSSAASQLRGFVEVAGQKAEVVIANPAGISVNGGGFINANAVTLTTGAPLMNGGNLDGYRVTGGSISIDGAGLDTSGAAYTRILARAAQVNAGIWAQDLKVVTGAHQSNADASTVSAIAPAPGSAPAYALDVAALGGMYAGKIMLIGTEAGLGVNNAGSLAASNGDLVLLADGQLTNRGVLDGRTTQVQVHDLQNLGTGRIYGDHVALQTATLNNAPETVGASTSAPVIAARSRLDIGAQTITNSDQALILSGGDLAIGGQLDANRQATGSANTVRNGSATIEALGNLSIQAGTLTNANDHFAYSVQLVDTQTGIYEYFNPQYYRSFNRYVYEPVVTQDAPGQILAGGNLTLAASQIDNQQSRIVAGGTLSATAASINNQTLTDQQRINDVGTQWSWGVTGGHDSCWPCHWVLDWGMVASAYNVNTYTTMTVAQGAAAANSSAASVPTTLARSSATVAATPSSTSVLGNALYGTPANPAATYLVETDPRFTNYRAWLSSDYLLSALALDPTLVQKRLGDGFLEQRLVIEQVAQLTGRRYLSVDYRSDEQQYQALMDAGVTYARAHSLRPGIALTAEQLAQLTSDIVWLVEQTVTLKDGSTRQALVPRVYAAPRGSDLTLGGALLAGRGIQLATTGDVLNSGLITADQLQLAAANLNNRAGTIDGTQVLLSTAQDLNNQGGTLAARDSLTLQAGGNVNLSTATAPASGSNRTTLDRQAVVYVSGAGKTLNISAGKDINLTAAQVRSAGSAQLQAGGDIRLNALTNAETFHAESHGEAEFRQHVERSTQTGSSISAAGDLNLLAMNNISGTAATVSAQGQARVIAGNTITFVEGRDVRSDELQWQATSHEFLSQTDTTTRIANSQNTAVRGSISGSQGVTLQAGQAVQMSAQQISAEQGDLHISAPQIVITSGLNATSHSESVESRKTGLSFADATGTFRPGQGWDHQNAQDRANSQTTLANTTLTARNITLATDAAAGDITLTAVQLKATGTPEGQPGQHTGGHDDREHERSDSGRSNPGRIVIDAGGGTVHFNTVQTTEVASLSRKESDIAWQGASGSGHQDQKAEYNRMEGQLSVNARQVTVQTATPPSTSLQQTVQTLTQQPGMAWIGQLQSDPAVAAKVDWQKIDEAHKNWQYDKQGLTPAGATVLTLVVAYFTAGAGSGAAASTGTATTSTAAGAAAGTTAAGTAATTGATWAGAYGAAMTAGQNMLLSQATVAMVNNGGDIGKTLEQLGSQDNVKVLLTAMLTAGALNSLNNTVSYSGAGGNVPPGTLNTGQTANNFNSNLLRNITNNLASASIDAAISGKRLDENALASSLRSAFITTSAAQGANAIGDARSDGTLNAYTQAVAHAVLGCAAGAAMTDGGCEAGAAGGIVGELSAKFHNPDGRGDTAKTAAFARMMSGIAGALVSGDANGAASVNIAAATGSNAAQNNYLKHTERQQLRIALQSCYAQGNDQACQTAAALQRKDELSDKLLADAAASCKGSECNEVSSFIQRELSALGCVAPSACQDYRTLSSYWQVAQAKAQGLEPVYPEGWLLDAKAVLDLGKLGVRAVNSLTTGGKSSLEAVSQLSRTDAQTIVNNFYRDGAQISYGKSVVATNPNEAVFWSGKTDGTGGVEAAKPIASRTGGQTLEQLIESRGISMPAYDPTVPSSVQAWQDLSREFARNASGDVTVVLGSQLRPLNIWQTIEFPELMRNPAVSRVISIDPKTKVEKILFQR